MLFRSRAEKTTDLTTGKSMQAISLIPNSSTGVGKLVSKTTGIGDEARSYYIDFGSIGEIKKALEKMKQDTSIEPKVYTRFTYVCKGGFTISVTYLMFNKNPVWVGQVGNTGNMPIGDFFSEILEAISKIEPKFAEFN